MTQFLPSMNFYLQKAKPKTVYNQQIVISQFIFVCILNSLWKKCQWKQPMCSLMDAWIKKTPNAHTYAHEEYY